MSSSTSRLSHPLLRASVLLWVVIIALFVWAFQSTSLSDLLIGLQALQVWQIGILLLVNLGIAILFSGRWWVILGGLGYRLPYLATAGYRLAAFSLSYFTPGPHFGGEPLQVYLPKRRHQVPGTTAVAAVALDKSLEMAVNVSVIVGGAALFVIMGRGQVQASWPLVGLAAGFLLLPLAYLLSTRQGYRPLSWLVRRLPVSPRLGGWLESSEQQIGWFCRQRGRALLLAFAFSILSWVAMIGEYWLAAQFVGLQITPLQALIALTAMRAAFFMPLPGGLGALEASQVLALGLLGFSPASALTVVVLIRARDLWLGFLGLGLTTFYLRAGERVPITEAGVPVEGS